MTFYRRTLPHLQRDYKPHFITFCTRNRWCLPIDVRGLVLSCCIHDHKKKADVHAAIVMPDHVHLLLTPMLNEQRRDVYSLAELLGSIKGASSHAINHRLGRSGSIWQEESFDHVLRWSEALDEKIVYLLENPVRAGIVSSAREYKWLWTADPEIMGASDL